MAHNTLPSQWLTAVQAQKEQHTKAAYCCYFLLGSGILAPWNAFITAADYFEAVFPGRHMDRLFTIAYLPVCLFLLGVLINYNTIPVRPRILSSFAGFTAIMAVVPGIDWVLVGDSSTGSNTALLLMLLAVVLVGVLDGMSQGAIFGDASVLPPHYTHAVVGGTASSGVVICLLRILTKAALPPTRAGLRVSTAIYFALSGAVSLACFCTYHTILPRLGVVQHYRQKIAVLELSPRSSYAAAASTAIHEAVAATEDDQHPLVHRHSGSSTHTCELPKHTENPLHSSSHLTPDGLSPAAAAAAAAVTAAKQQKALSWQHVMAEAWQSVLALFIVYVITLSIFPGVLAEDAKSDALGSWYPILLITLFNVCDLIGKNIPFGHFKPCPRTLLTWSAGRAVFVPAFLLAGRHAKTATWLMSLLTISLGLSNGLLTALLMTLAPASVVAGEAGLVENIMVFSLVAGLTVGAFAGWLWLM